MQNVSRSYLILSGFSIFILAILYDKVFKNAEKEYCVNADCSKVILKNNLRLSTKTPYRAVQNDIVEEIIFTGNMVIEIESDVLSLKLLFLRPSLPI